MLTSKSNTFYVKKRCSQNFYLMPKAMSIEFLLVKITINKEHDWLMKFILN